MSVISPEMSQEKSKTMLMQIFWGVKEVSYGIVQVENNYVENNHVKDTQGHIRPRCMIFKSNHDKFVVLLTVSAEAKT